MKINYRSEIIIEKIFDLPYAKKYYDNNLIAIREYTDWNYRIGIRRFILMYKKYGLEGVEEYMEDMQDKTNKEFKILIEKIFEPEYAQEYYDDKIHALYQLYEQQVVEKANYVINNNWKKAAVMSAKITKTILRIGDLTFQNQ